MDDTVCYFSISEISALTMQYHGSFNDKTIDIDDSFTFDDASTTYSCNGKSFNSDDTELTEAFKTFYTALSEISYRSLDTSAELRQIPSRLSAWSIPCWTAAPMWQIL